jgi:hypothetical protein
MPVYRGLNAGAGKGPRRDGPKFLNGFGLREVKCAILSNQKDYIQAFRALEA